MNRSHSSPACRAHRGAPAGNEGCPRSASRFRALSAAVLWLVALSGALADPPAASDPQPAADVFAEALVAAAMERTKHAVRYDGSYRRIAYPGGDVPPDVGVCTDVVVRAYRRLGIDLQVGVHEDMTASFDAYPTRWGLTRPDPNIDHRRVPNLQVFFRRHGEELPVTDDPDDYRPGDLVTWILPRNLPHVGIVVARRSDDGQRPMIVHNIGRGPVVEDMLFDYPIDGHFRYRGPERTSE